MAIRSTIFTKPVAALIAVLGGAVLLPAQEVETLELSTSTVRPLTARLGCASLIQLPVEPVATNVGDAQLWMVERTDKYVSIKPVSAGAKNTSLAILTRQGTLSFSVRLAPDTEPFTQMVRVTKIVDDSKPLPPTRVGAEESIAEVVIREIRLSQNFYALKQVNAPELRGVEQVTQLRDTGTPRVGCTLLQVFRFQDSRHLVLHFITENKTEDPITLEHRRTTVNVGDAYFAPIAVSLGKNTLASRARSENFVVLDGSGGLSPKNTFAILLVEMASELKQADETH